MAQHQDLRPIQHEVAVAEPRSTGTPSTRKYSPSTGRWTSKASSNVAAIAAGPDHGRGLRREQVQMQAAAGIFQVAPEDGHPPGDGRWVANCRPFPCRIQMQDADAGVEGLDNQAADRGPARAWFRAEHGEMPAPLRLTGLLLRQGQPQRRPSAVATPSTRAASAELGKQ